MMDPSTAIQQQEHLNQGRAAARRWPACRRASMTPRHSGGGYIGFSLIEVELRKEG